MGGEKWVIVVDGVDDGSGSTLSTVPYILSSIYRRVHKIEVGDCLLC